MTDISALKICAKASEDIDILASTLQDAIFPLCDMAWLRDEGEFIAVINRYKWDTTSKDEPSERTNCGLHFHHVTDIQTRNIDIADRSLMLHLLTVRHQKTDDDKDSLHLVFSEDADILITASEICIFLQDIGEPWPAVCCPTHLDKETAQENAKE